MSDDEIKNNNVQEPDDSGDLEFDETEGQMTDKLKKLRSELKASDSEKKEYLDGWQRAKADYLNLKKDLDKERSDYVRLARESFLHDLLPLADSFEMAFANKSAWEQAPANWRQGVEYIYQQLETIFEQAGLEKIDALGQVFNPEEQEAIGTIDSSPADEGKVLEILKKGYKLNGKIIRPAQVKIGKSVEVN